MNVEKVFLGCILFFGLFAGASTFQQSFFQSQGIEDNTSTALDEEYASLKENIDSMRKNVNQVQSPDTGILDSAVAGLYLVPDFLSLILSPITILGSALDTIGAAYWFVPEFLTTMIKYVVYMGVAFGAFRLLIGLRSG